MTVDPVACKLIEMQDKQNDATPPNPAIVMPDIVQPETGKMQSRRSVYNKTFKRSNYFSSQRLIIII